MIFVKNSNLPEKAHTVLVGEEYFKELSAPLSMLGINALAIPQNPFVDSRISSHADISVFHLKDNILYLSPHLLGSKLETELKKLGFTLYFSKAEFSSAYPHDCPLNIYSSEDFAVLNFDSADQAAIDALKQSNKRLIGCRQGYTKCMNCPVDSNSLISSDPSVVSACKEHGIDVLEIRQGYVDLLGFEYGFLGGACFKVSRNTMAFTGKLDLHPDREIILDFLNKKGIEVIYLTERNVFDVGSIIPIMEKPR